MAKKTYISLLCLGLIVVLAACSFSVTTANYSNLAMAGDVDENNGPIGVTTTFAVDSPLVYVTGLLKNAPEGTVITAEWYYLESDPVVFIDGASYESVDTTTTFNFSLSKPTAGWPLGGYEVKLYIDDVYKETLAFKVE